MFIYSKLVVNLPSEIPLLTNFVDKLFYLHKFAFKTEMMKVVNDR